MKYLWQKFNNSKLAKFVFVGGLNTAVGYAVFTCLVLLHVHYVLSSILGHITGVTHSYFWNKYFTFRVPGKNFGEVVRFVGVYTVHYIISLGGLVLLVEIFKLHPLLVQAIVLLVTSRL